MIWLRAAGLALFLSGSFLLMLVPMLGHTVLLGSAAASMMVGGAALLSAGMRRRYSSDRGAGGPYGRASALDIGEGSSHHDSGHDGGHGGDGGH
jgi:hypothetical protein